MVKFIVFFDNQVLKTYEINDPLITIGRLPENTICISHMSISRRHAKIERDAGNNYILTDLNSLNGTLVNNIKVKKATLSHGDKITVGKYTILFENAEESQTKSAPSQIIKESIEVSSTTLPQDMPPQHEQTSIVQEQKQASSCDAVLIEINKHVIYKLDKPLITFGASESDDIYISGFLVDEGHVIIERVGNEYWIRSQKFLSSFKVNGKKTKSHRLTHKDRIEIGSNIFRFMENG